MIILALLENWLYIDRSGQSSMMAYSPCRGGRFEHGD
jgi:hypothetical protein